METTHSISSVELLNGQQFDDITQELSSASSELRRADPNIASVRVQIIEGGTANIVVDYREPHNGATSLGVATRIPVDHVTTTLCVLTNVLMNL